MLEMEHNSFVFIICKCLYSHPSYDYSNISYKNCEVSESWHGITTTQIAQLDKSRPSSDENHTVYPRKNSDLLPVSRDKSPSHKE